MKSKLYYKDHARMTEPVALNDQKICSEEKIYDIFHSVKNIL